MIVDEALYHIINEAEKITMTNYSEDIYWKDAENVDGYIDETILVDIIKDLICEVEHRDEEIEDINRDLYDNYVRIPVSSQVE